MSSSPESPHLDNRHRNTLRYRLEYALVVTFLYDQHYTCDEYCKYYKNVENATHKFIPAVHRTYYDGSISHVTGIVTISKDEFDAMPPTFDGAWLRENFPGPDVVTDDQLMAHARATGSTTYHPIGTCKLGTDPMAVVDPKSMRVIGLDGLRVADASCMPTMVSGNTYAATNMIAEKASDLIAA